MNLPLSIGRYLVAHYLRWFTALYISVLALVALVDFTELLRQASSKPHVTGLIVVKMAILHLPFLSSKLSPFITLFTTFIALWKLNNASELTAMRAAGMSVQRILLPLALTVMIFGCFELLVLNPFTAMMTDRYERTKAYQFHGKKKELIVSQSGMWVRHAKNYLLIVVRCKEVNLKKHQLRQVMLLTYDGRSEFKARYHAKTLTFAENDTLVLEDGWYISRIGEVRHFKKEKLKNDLDISVIQHNQPRPETISFWNLTKYIDWLRQSGLSLPEYLVQKHSLVSQIILLVSMVLLAGAFSFRPPRQRGGKLLISAGLSIGFTLYILKDITHALGSIGALPPLIAAWMPSIVSLLCGVALVIYQEDA